MIEMQVIRAQTADVVERLKVKNFDAAEIIDRILEVDGERRKTQKSLDDTLAESNQLARDIGALFKSGKRDEAEQMKERTALLKQQVKALQEILETLTAEQGKLLVQLPNLPHASVPQGKSAEDNDIVHSEGEVPVLVPDAMPHWELAKKYDLIDFECGTRITGAGFPVYKGKGARLQRALIGFFLDSAVEAGYTEYQPPLLVNEASAYATGQLPDKEGQMYHVQLDNLYLIPTAEVPVTNFFRDMILRQEDLPAAEIELLGPTGSQRIDTLVRDIVERSSEAGDIVQSEEIGAAMLRLRKFMFDRVYLGPEARREHERVRRAMRGLFDHYMEHPEELPAWDAGATPCQRVADYIAGMTDRYCIAKFTELTVPEESRF